VTAPTDGHPEDRLSAYLDDELELPERDAVDRHLARCERCRADLASLRRLARGIAEERIPDPPGDLAGRIGRALDDAAVVRLPRRRYAVPATIAATLAAVGILIAVRWQSGRVAAPEVPLPPPIRQTAPAAPPSEAEGLPQIEAKQKAAAPPPAPRRAASDEKDREELALDRSHSESDERADLPTASAPVDAMKDNAAQSAAAGGGVAAPAPAAALERAKSGLAKVADACGDRWTDAGSPAVWEVDDAAAAAVELEALARGLGGRSDGAETQVAAGRSVIVPPSSWAAFAREAAARGIAGVDARADAGAIGCIRQRIELRPKSAPR